MPKFAPRPPIQLLKVTEFVGRYVMKNDEEYKLILHITKILVNFLIKPLKINEN